MKFPEIEDPWDSPRGGDDGSDRTRGQNPDNQLNVIVHYRRFKVT
jgi:hypothetical protein